MTTMKRPLLKLAPALLACAFAGVAVAADSGQAAAERPPSPGAQHQLRLPLWSYEGETGPAKWGEIDPKFRVCASGKRQSPINIDTRSAEKGGLKPILFSYESGAAEVINTGRAIEVDLPKAGSARFDGLEYRLTQLHFHTPSEERIDNMAQHMVAHLVHRAGDTRIAVVAVLFKLGKENAVLKPVFENMPALATQRASLKDFNPAGLLPADPTYYAFTGSLTTPPCSEEVKWHVMKTPVEISYRQLAALKAMYKNNVRPLQPLNGRRVQVYQPE